MSIEALVEAIVTKDDEIERLRAVNAQLLAAAELAVSQIKLFRADEHNVYARATLRVLVEAIKEAEKDPE